MPPRNLPKARKSAEFLRDIGVGEWVISNFLAYAQEITEPDYFPRVIDGAFEATYERFLSCGATSRPARAARDVDPLKVRVTIEPAPVLMPYSTAGQNVYANGCTDGVLIRAVVCYVNSMSKPPEADLVTCAQLIEWEMGNLFARKGGHHARDVDSEVGNRQPCAFF